MPSCTPTPMLIRSHQSRLVTSTIPHWKTWDFSCDRTTTFFWNSCDRFHD
ncbi:MAG: hypothetical protein KME54_28925 [Tolypothrix brevis GSE-NOS-MK-07-07A]|nr:hypothetical protein [Tolypothrix brevis GSE-NOS-MK-07-07A]